MPYRRIAPLVNVDERLSKHRIGPVGGYGVLGRRAGASFQNFLLMPNCTRRPTVEPLAYPW
jgi:hypothetical protein